MNKNDIIDYINFNWKQNYNYNVSYDIVITGIYYMLLYVNNNSYYIELKHVKKFILNRKLKNILYENTI